MPLPRHATPARTTDEFLPSDSPSLLHGRVLAFAAILLAAINLRTAVTSITPLLDVLGQQFGFGTTMTGVLGMLPTASFALFGVATPALARRLGLERTTLLAMVMAMAGLLLRSSAGNVGTLLLGSVVALAGMGIGNVVVPPLVKRYFANKVGTMSTLYISVLQLGTMLPALLAVPVANAAGWRVSLGMWALLALAAALPWLLLARRAPAPQADATDPAAQPRQGLAHVTGLEHDADVRHDLADDLFDVHLAAAHRGRSRRHARVRWRDGGGVLRVGAAAVAGHPSMAVRMQNPFPLVLIGYSSFVIAFAGLLLAPMKAPLLWACLLGVGPSTFPLALTLINLRTRTPTGSAALSGFMQGVGYSFSCLGPFLVGWLHTVSTGWTLPFSFLFGCATLMLCASWVACKPRKLEDLW